MTDSGDILVGYDGGGLTFSNLARQPRLFRILSGSNPYAAEAVFLNEDTGARTAEGGVNLTTAHNLLWEVNGNTSVPANTIVEATPNPAGAGFWFTAPAAVFSPTVATRQVTTNVTLPSSGALQVLDTYSLPSAGTYLLFASVTASLTSTAAGATVEAYFANAIGYASPRATVCSAAAAGVTVQGTATMVTVMQTFGILTANLTAAVVPAGTGTGTVIGGPTASATTFSGYLRIA